MEAFISVLATAYYIAICVLLFSLAIAIHEFGHFIVALKLGLRVERFSIGFGPAIWKKTWRGVEYRISWIPLGGYVTIPDVDPEGTKKLEGGSKDDRKGKEPEGSRRNTPPWKELLVAFAGPGMNIVLAAVIACILSLTPEARFAEPTMEVGSIKAGGLAERAGLQIGDKVLKVGGRPVDNWTKLCLEVQYATNKTVELEVSRPVRRRLEIELTPAEGLGGSGYAAGVMSAGVVRGDKLLPWIGEVMKGSPADKAGIRRGDEIESAGGARTECWEDFAKAMRESGGKPVKLAVVRKDAAAPGETLKLTVKAEDNVAGFAALDAAPALSGAAPWMVSRNPAEQLAYDAKQIFYVIKRLFTDTKETSKQLGGPVLIAEQIYANVRRDVWDGLGFLRFLNINLAILNLLPIPVLDGGLILFALIAMAFRRRLPEKFVNGLSTVFMWLLLAGVAVLIWRDTERTWKIHRAKAAIEAAEEAGQGGEDGAK